MYSSEGVGLLTRSGTSGRDVLVMGSKRIVPFSVPTAMVDPSGDTATALTLGSNRASSVTTFVSRLPFHKTFRPSQKNNMSPSGPKDSARIGSSEALRHSKE